MVDGLTEEEVKSLIYSNMDYFIHEVVMFHLNMCLAAVYSNSLIKFTEILKKKEKEG